MDRSSRPGPGGGPVGFVFGVILGSMIGVWWWASDMGWFSLVPPVAVAILGAKFGDRFWYWFLERLRWFY